jgi:hypothetical protein
MFYLTVILSVLAFISGVKSHGGATSYTIDGVTDLRYAKMNTTCFMKNNNSFQETVRNAETEADRGL